MTVFAVVTIAACALGMILADLRWLRVAQREHYLPGSLTRFAIRWWGRDARQKEAVFLGLAGVIASGFVPPLALVTAAIVAFGPKGLGIRGRTSPLSWTRRLRTVAATTALIAAVAVALVGLVGGQRAAVVCAAAICLFAPILCDAALAILRPVEDRFAMRFVREAQVRLSRVHPIIVGITGSYGKTSTKAYLAHLLAGRYAVVASPRSYNNRAGLARTVNELLVAGTDVLVAEMGAYRRGEIANLCRWLPPKVAVITAIGPVHLERFKTLEATLSAKAEIASSAETVVLNVDDPRLLALSSLLSASGKNIMSCSSRTRDADVAVIGDGELSVYLHGAELGTVHASFEPHAIVGSNVACAIGAAIALGCTPDEILKRLHDLPTPENRLQSYPGANGVLVLDDTFNANPAGAERAIALLAKSGEPNCRRVVVSPGMVELGPVQFEENARFGERAAEDANVVVVVGDTNRRAITEGVRRHGERTKKKSDRPKAEPIIVTVRDREEGVAWVKRTLTTGDVVLYENDLPDHFF